MKSKYIVLRGGNYDETGGRSIYKKVKTFKNEPEAIAFVSDPKNLRMHGELFLKCHNYDGNRREWDACKKEWVRK